MVGTVTSNLMVTKATVRVTATNNTEAMVVNLTNTVTNLSMVTDANLTNTVTNLAMVTDTNLMNTVTGFLRKGNYAERVGARAPVYLATVMEYLVGNAARDNKKTRVIPRHLQLVIIDGDDAKNEVEEDEIENECDDALSRGMQIRCSFW